MKFLLCIFISTFCVFTQADPLSSLYELITESRLIEEIDLRMLQEAKQGDSYAQAKLAFFYYKEHIDLKNKTKASKELEQSFYWFKKAANQGNVHAQVMLGWAYCCAEDDDFRAKKGFFFKTPLVKEDWAKAAYWFNKSAGQGNPQAPAFTEETLKELETKIGYEEFLKKLYGY